MIPHRWIVSAPALPAPVTVPDAAAGIRYATEHGLVNPTIRPA